MRYQNIHSKSSVKKTFKSQIILCIFILIVLSIIKLIPNENLQKTKNAVSLIINTKTDIKAELLKIKDFFVEDEKIASMNPVSDFISPVKGGEVVKGFGVQDADKSGFNYGVDIKLSDDKNVLSAAGGEVTEIATNEESGTYIIIKHSDEISTLYSHLNEVLPSVGERVESGQVVARANNENNTIHFEIKRNDTYLDPADFIDFGEGND